MPESHGMTIPKDPTRRKFVGSLLGSAALAALLGRLPAAAASPAPEAEPPAHPANDRMPTRPLGRTGHQVTIFSMGGQATIEDPSKFDESVAILHRALDLGVNYVDTAPVYGNGASERAIGDVMRSRRQEVFLASKTHDRSYDGSMRLLEASLKRLNTDRLDLWQLHNVKTEADLGFIFSREGALRAMERARDEGMVRFVGITGHEDPHVIRSALERHPFDTALLAVNAADRHDASFIDHALPTAVEQGIGVIGMKIPGRGKLLRPDGVRTMEQAMRYGLTLPISTAIVGISTVEQLEENVAIAMAFRPYTPDEMAALEALTRPYHAEALWYRHGY